MDQQVSFTNGSTTEIPASLQVDSIGGRLSGLRERKSQNRLGPKLTQAKLAKALACSESAIAQWEGNQKLPSTNMLIKIARYYSTSTDYILGLTDYDQAVKLDPTDGLINWEAGVIPLNESNRNAKRLFKMLSSGKFRDWESLLSELNNKRARSEDVIRAIEEAIARELIEVKPLERDKKLEKALKERFKFLKDRALVVSKIPKAFAGFPDFQQLLVSLSAAHCFDEIVQAGDDVALSGGSTLLRWARCITFDERLKGLTFYPLDINPLASQVELNASSIVALLKVRLNCKGFALHHEAMSDAQFDPADLSKEAFDVLQRGARSCKLAFVGIGNPLSRDFLRVAHNEYASRERLKEAGVKADLLFRLLDAKGEEIELANNFNKRVASMQLEDLKRIARMQCAIGVVHGEDKAEALRAVLAGEYISGIVTHSTLADKVLALK